MKERLPHTPNMYSSFGATSPLPPSSTRPVCRVPTNSPAWGGRGHCTDNEVNETRFHVRGRAAYFRGAFEISKAAHVARGHTPESPLPRHSPFKSEQNQTFHHYVLPSSAGGASGSAGTASPPPASGVNQLATEEEKTKEQSPHQCHSLQLELLLSAERVGRLEVERDEASERAGIHFQCSRHLLELFLTTSKSAARVEDVAAVEERKESSLCTRRTKRPTTSPVVSNGGRLGRPATGGGKPRIVSAAARKREGGCGKGTEGDAAHFVEVPSSSLSKWDEEPRRPLTGHVRDSELLRALQRAEQHIAVLEHEKREFQQDRLQRSSSLPLGPLPQFSSVGGARTLPSIQSAAPASPPIISTVPALESCEAAARPLCYSTLCVVTGVSAQEASGKDLHRSRHDSSGHSRMWSQGLSGVLTKGGGRGECGEAPLGPYTPFSSTLVVLDDNDEEIDTLQCRMTC